MGDHQISAQYSYYPKDGSLRWIDYVGRKGKESSNKDCV